METVRLRVDVRICFIIFKVLVLLVPYVGCWFQFRFLPQGGASSAEASLQAVRGITYIFCPSPENFKRKTASYIFIYDIAKPTFEFAFISRIT